MYRDVKLKLISNKIAELVTENIKDCERTREMRM